MRISLTRKTIVAIKIMLADHWPTSRRHAKARNVLINSMAGKLWNLTYVVRAGRYFVWRLLSLTGLHNERDPKNQNVVSLGGQFHADFLFWKWAINRKLLQAGEAVSAPCYTALQRPAKRTAYPTPASTRSACIASRGGFSGDTIYHPH